MDNQRTTGVSGAFAGLLAVGGLFVGLASGLLLGGAGGYVLGHMRASVGGGTTGEQRASAVPPDTGGWRSNRVPGGAVTPEAPTMVPTPGSGLPLDPSNPNLEDLLREMPPELRDRFRELMRGPSDDTDA